MAYPILVPHTLSFSLLPISDSLIAFGWLDFAILLTRENHILSPILRVLWTTDYVPSLERSTSRRYLADSTLTSDPGPEQTLGQHEMSLNLCCRSSRPPSRTSQVEFPTSHALPHPQLKTRPDILTKLLSGNVGNSGEESMLARCLKRYWKRR